MGFSANPLLSRSHQSKCLREVIKKQASEEAVQTSTPPAAAAAAVAAAANAHSLYPQGRPDW